MSVQQKNTLKSKDFEVIALFHKKTERSKIFEIWHFALLCMYERNCSISFKNVERCNCWDILKTFHFIIKSTTLDFNVSVLYFVKPAWMAWFTTQLATRKKLKYKLQMTKLTLENLEKYKKQTKLCRTEATTLPWPLLVILLCAILN